MIRQLQIAGVGAVLAGCNLIVNIDDDQPIDGTLIVFDASDAVPQVDAPFEPSNCMMDLPCPSPDDGRATICGRLWDIETDQTIMGSNPSGGSCGFTQDGPCSMSVRFFDALDFAQDPMNAQPLQAESVIVDDCGRFRGRNIMRATFGFIGVVVDDATGTADRHAPTAVVTSNAIASPERSMRAYLTRRTTDQAWTAASGLGGGPTFSERGALLNVFTYHGVPRAGVQIRRNGSNVPAAESFGFADPGVTRSMLDPQQDTTGPNGSVLVINSPTPIAHDAVGGEPPGCIWPSQLGASTPGVILMQRKEAEGPGGAPCP